MLSEEKLKQAAEELAHALNESLPKPEQCQHHRMMPKQRFFENFHFECSFLRQIASI